jgi:hypothetical protein
VHCGPPQINKNIFYLDVPWLELPAYGNLGRHAKNSATPPPLHPANKWSKFLKQFENHAFEIATAG